MDHPIRLLRDTSNEHDSQVAELEHVQEKHGTSIAELESWRSNNRDTVDALERQQSQPDRGFLRLREDVVQDHSRIIELGRYLRCQNDGTTALEDWRRHASDTVEGLQRQQSEIESRQTQVNQRLKGSKKLWSVATYDLTNPARIRCIIARSLPNAINGKSRLWRP